MEISWQVTKYFLGLLLINLCTAFPLGLGAPTADLHSQFLTGLIGVLLTICGIVCLIGCLCCQRHNGFREFHNNPVVASSTSSLDHGLTNPITNGEFTIFTPLSPYQNNIFLAHEQIVQNDIDSNQAGVDIHSWFDGTQTDFPRAKLKYIKELGKGWFGRVVEGTAQGINGEDQTWTPVAVRILEASATNSERAVFLHDARIYRCEHPHILQLLGRNLESIPLLFLQELCPKGDLKKYLLENQKIPEKLLNSVLPLLWCCQLSSAIQHLHDNGLTHPDLAARNCQLVSDISLKLGDYGLAASFYPEDYYQGAPAVPVRWCAPESLTYTSTTIQPKQISSEGNIWSLGVTMWEIFECGAQPYAHLSDDEVISHVLGSATVRLSAPRFSLLYTNYIYRLMQLCWSTSELRPPISQIHLMLSDLLQVYQHTKDLPDNEPLISMQDFDNRWDTLKPNSITRTDNHQFHFDESKADSDVDNIDITVLNLKLDKDTKVMSASLNNLHGSLDNLAEGEMDSWLQKLATKTGDMSYVRGLSEAINDLDNTLAMENVSSSDSSYLPSPAPEHFPDIMNKLEFKLGPIASSSNDTIDISKTENSSFTESTQRTSSESETEDETWRKKVEQGAYSEKVHQKSKSVADLMILTHIDYSESESETPLPSLDYRVNYKNVRYAPLQNLENVSLTFGSEGNLLSVHDKFQEELKRLQEEHKDSLLFVPECSVSHFDKSEESSDTLCNINAPSDDAPHEKNDYSVNASPHRRPVSLIEELSSPTEIQPGNQIYNVFNVTVGSSFNSNFNNGSFEPSNPSSSFVPSLFQVPKLLDIIQNNDNLMDYIISRYESQNDTQSNIGEIKTVPEYQVQFDVSLTQDELLPCSMTHSAVDLNSTYTLDETLEFSSNFGIYNEHYDESREQDQDADLKYSLETWSNFLGDALPESSKYSSDFSSFPSESQSLGEDCNRTQSEENQVTEIETSKNSTNYNHLANGDLIVNNSTKEEDNSETNSWEPTEGWFLHPQSNSDVSGQLESIQLEDDVEGYVGFSMDDEVMAAIRNELLLKLPQAQGHSSEQVRDYDECDSEERNEVHIKYNLYTTPLSPIPEESYSECDATYYICNKENSSGTDDDDEEEEWPAPYEEQNSDLTNLEAPSVLNVDSLGHGNQNRHTPSQDSCCSNDTLFNLEELTCGVNENESSKERKGCESKMYKSGEGEHVKTDVPILEKHTEDIYETNIPEDRMHEIQNTFAEDMANSIIRDHLNDHFPIKCNVVFLVNHHIYSRVHDKNTYIFDIDNLKHDIDKTGDVTATITNNLDSTIDKNDNLNISHSFKNHIDDKLHSIYNQNGFNIHLLKNKQWQQAISENKLINGYLEDKNIINISRLKDNELHTDDIDPTKTEIARSDINQNDNTAFNWEVTQKTSGTNGFKYIIDSADTLNKGGGLYTIENKLHTQSYDENVSSCKSENEHEATEDESYAVATLNIKNIQNGIEMDGKCQNHLIRHTDNIEPESFNYITKFLDCERKNIDNCFKPDNCYANIDDIQINMIQEQYANIVHEEQLYDVVHEESPEYDIYNVLTDIRFNGPADVQLMSTSFSESADIDEQDWDSGSDTRSSSSGEFIWKEGEHEESVKALRAAPQDENALEKAETLGHIEEASSESSDDDDAEDVDSPEFVPSAWDKYATPTKSALRSPEKTLERSEVKHNKPKGVWFKKQKYHCVYEYPKEPESPVINNYELWQPTSKSVLDWEVDTSPYIPHYDSCNYVQYNLEGQDNIYHRTGIPDDEFYISSTTRPFDTYSGLSQFFPGSSDNWDVTKADNITPDSGIEDITPLPDFTTLPKVQTLKILAAMALKQNHVNVIKNNKAALGGLRHARNKLKLDLPTSPSSFSYAKTFTLEPQEEPITRCVVPTFTTFGKSRFLVQQVDTANNDEENGCNVSFEAIPYKPIKNEKSKVEIVRGEASLLDSADEDSGIESSTLERKITD